MKANIWNAVVLARQCEAIAPQFGFHTALTGGCLYKDGDRKDMDILFYKHSGYEPARKYGLLLALVEKLGFVLDRDYGRVVKARYNGVVVDLLFPGFDGEYKRDLTDEGRLI